MIACVDVAYCHDDAIAACVVFRSWSDVEAACELVEKIGEVHDYLSGEFYRRELPPILAVLRRVTIPLEVVVVDGYVWLASGKPGLGGHLYDALQKRTAVIGVAKSRFAGADLAIPILRGRSKRPLYVTAAGMSADDAAKCILAMHGGDRIPTLMKRVDFLSRRGSIL